MGGTRLGSYVACAALPLESHCHITPTTPPTHQHTTLTTPQPHPTATPRLTQADKSEFKHQVKPLQIIWSKFPQWSARNTLHLDDLSRNFALNPSCGVKCKVPTLADTMLTLSFSWAL